MDIWVVSISLIVNSAAMNMWMHVSFLRKVLSVYMPKSVVTGSYGSSMYRFLRYLHTVLHCGCTSLQSHQQCRRVLCASQPLLLCWWECKLIQSLWRSVWRYLRNLYIELPYDPAIPLLGIYPDKTFLKKDTCTLMFIVSVFTIADIWKQPKCPSTDDWIRKRW